jgi:hypothetical protein
MMDKSAIFGALWAAWGAPTCGMGPPQPFPIAVIGKITQIFLETQVIWGMSAKAKGV